MKADGKEPVEEKHEPSREKEAGIENSLCKAPTKAVGMECKARMEGLVLEGEREASSPCSVTGLGWATASVQAKEGRFTCLLAGR